ncbi:hypothetical protein GCM10027614_82920 [Micromonospora vulcania]
MTGHPVTSGEADAATRLYEEALASSDGGRPARAVRQLRAGLRLVTGRPALTELRARILLSLAWAESERGRVDLGFQLLDEAETDAPAQVRPILLAQRALLLKRAGHNTVALAHYDAAIALLTEPAYPQDLVRALNNRSLVHQEAGDLRLARADLTRALRIATRQGFELQAAVIASNIGCLDVTAGDLPAALRAFAAARVTYQVLAPGRLANLAVERARALLAAGLFVEADRELAAAVSQAQGQRLDHTYADALQVRAEAALLAREPQAAIRWARQARAAFLLRRNSRRAALAELIALRAHQEPSAAPVGRPTTTGRALALAARLNRLGLSEDAWLAGIVAARSMTAAGRTAHAERMLRQRGRPRRIDRLDTRLLWWLARAELAFATGHPAQARGALLAGMAALHRHRTQFGSLDLQTGAAARGQDLASAGLAAAVASGSTTGVYRWSERAAPRHCCCRRYGHRPTRARRHCWRNCARAGTPSATPNSPAGPPRTFAAGSRNCSGRYARDRGRPGATPTPGPRRSHPRPDRGGAGRRCAGDLPGHRGRSAGPGADRSVRLARPAGRVPGRGRGRAAVACRSGRAGRPRHARTTGQRRPGRDPTGRRTARGHCAEPTPAPDRGP